MAMLGHFSISSLAAGFLLATLGAAIPLCVTAYSLYTSNVCSMSASAAVAGSAIASGVMFFAIGIGGILLLARRDGFFDAR